MIEIVFNEGDFLLFIDTFVLINDHVFNITSLVERSNI